MDMDDLPSLSSGASLGGSKNERQRAVWFEHRGERVVFAILRIVEADEHRSELALVARRSPNAESSGFRPAAQREVARSPLWGTLLRVQVVLSRKAEKQLAKLPGLIVKKLALWVDLVSVEGLVVARAIPGYRDHALKGEWSGNRRFG